VNNRKLKVAIDILLTAFFILSYGISVGMAISVHMAVGIIAAILSFAHVFINRKRFFAVFKISEVKRLNPKAKWQYEMSALLTITWTICVITGLLIGFPVILYSLVGITDLFMFFVIHILTAFLSLILVIVHVVQHIGHIKSYFKKRTAIIKEINNIGNLNFGVTSPTTAFSSMRFFE